MEDFYLQTSSIIAANGRAKICTQCGLEKPWGEFYSNSKTHDYVQAACKECHKKKRKQYYHARQQNNPIFKAKRKRTKRIRYLADKGQVFEILGKQCALCGDNYIFALSVDHINGNGAEERKRGERTLSLYKKIIDAPVDALVHYRTLCMKCNWLSRYHTDEEIVARYGNKKKT